MVCAAMESSDLLTGSRDNGDPLTTNVHIGNLPSTVSDVALGHFCCKFGPVASLKVSFPLFSLPICLVTPFALQIMWPRGGNETSGGAGFGMVALRQNKATGLNGFVAFMR